MLLKRPSSIARRRCQLIRPRQLLTNKQIFADNPMFFPYHVPDHRHRHNADPRLDVVYVEQAHNHMGHDGHMLSLLPGDIKYESHPATRRAEEDVWIIPRR